MESTTAAAEIDYSARRHAVAEYLRSHPERHDQGVWIEQDGFTCNSARMSIGGLGCGLFAPVGSVFWEGQVLLPDGELSDIDDYAQDLLDLSNDQAMDIFNCLNNAEALAIFESV